MHRFSLPNSLAESGISSNEVVTALQRPGRVDVTGLPAGAVAYLLGRAGARPDSPPMLVIVPDTKAARAMEADLRFCAGALDESARVVRYPATETTPFVNVAPDRSATMARLACLFQLAHDEALRFVVAPAEALVQRLPPRAAFEGRCVRLAQGEEVDREALIQRLTEAGYLRVPVVEDPGSFAARGGLLDIFPPYAARPFRAELDGDELCSIKEFDPDDQRSREGVEAFWVHPVRDIMLGEQERTRAREGVSDLCDAVNMPSVRRRQLLDDMLMGRGFLGLEAFLPAFYAGLDSLFDYLPRDSQCVLLDPVGAGQQLDQQQQRASRDRDARREEKAPSFELGDFYLTQGDLAEKLSQRPLTVFHSVLVGGATDPTEEGAFAQFAVADPQAAMRLVAEDQTALKLALTTQRNARASDPLGPLVQACQRWVEEGMRVLLAARSTTQADRLASLLRGCGLAVETQQQGLPNAGPPGVRVAVGSLGRGFVLPSEALVCVSESEIFGEQSRPRRQNRANKDKHRAFVEDLRQLAVNDYVVHRDHGIGRYLGLSRKQVPVTRFEALKGQRPKEVEVLVVEYATGDRLFLPVTRLNQIEKFASAEGGKPKLDRLGGQTFARTKSRVRGAVKVLADELLALYAARSARARPAYPAPSREYAQFEAAFPFDETPDQARAIEEVMSDLDAEAPMDRLVCGDVGFGKTEVALRAAFRVALSGKQVAVLCPTTVLAQQHLWTFRKRFETYPLRVEVLSRFVPKKDQAEVLAGLKDGTCDVVVGTHRLLSKDVHFKRLGLLVVDEEQRFGVAHKERIKKLKTTVDVLTLTATPIPRTLHMAVGGMRELSVISSPPQDRRAVRTFVTRWDDRVIQEAIERELARDGQAFFINNRIDRLFERAQKVSELCPRARIVTVHGRLKEQTLERHMTDFIEGKYDVLCSTALIENGLDIPRANTILIDRADTLGLSQLYQLRGRVGRSAERAYCYLIAPPPSDMTDEARTRIEALERFTQLGSGFQIASLDMELRGAGDLLGGAQSGNVAAVGFDLFVHMLQEAVAELRGEPVVHEVDPELSLDQEPFIPDDYIADVGVRLSFYKRLSAAADEQTVAELEQEMADRFGRPPTAALTFVRAMALKPRLRTLRVLGCEAQPTRVTLHFKDDTPVDAAQLSALVASSPQFQLTPDMKLTRRYRQREGIDGIDRVHELLQELDQL